MLSIWTKCSCKNQYCFIVYNYLAHAEGHKAAKLTNHIDVVGPQ